MYEQYKRNGKDATGQQREIAALPPSFLSPSSSPSLSSLPSKGLLLSPLPPPQSQVECSSAQCSSNHSFSPWEPPSPLSPYSLRSRNSSRVRYLLLCLVMS